MKKILKAFKDIEELKKQMEAFYEYKFIMSKFIENRLEAKEHIWIDTGAYEEKLYVFQYKNCQMYHRGINSIIFTGCFCTNVNKLIKHAVVRKDTIALTYENDITKVYYVDLSKDVFQELPNDMLDTSKLEWISVCANEGA